MRVWHSPYNEPFEVPLEAMAGQACLVWRRWTKGTVLIATQAHDRAAMRASGNAIQRLLVYHFIVQHYGENGAAVMENCPWEDPD